MSAESPEIRAPELRNLFDYWQHKRGGRVATARADIVPSEIKPLLQRIMIADVVGTPPRFRFRLAGTLVVDHFGEEITGRFLDELDLAKCGQHIVEEYRKVVESCTPLCSRWRYTKSSGKLVSYERLLMPLSSDGKAVDMILGAVAVEEPFGSPSG
jgi:hypothetical protein